MNTYVSNQTRVHGPERGLKKTALIWSQTSLLRVDALNPKRGTNRSNVVIRIMREKCVRRVVETVKVP